MCPIIERVTLVFENLPCEPPLWIDVHKTAKQLLDALHHLHHVVDCVHGLVTPNCLVWHDDQLKLAHWPISLLTSSGFALGAGSILPTNISFVSPEQVRAPGRQATKASDIWSAGLALLKLVNPKCKLPDNPCRLAFCDNVDQLIDLIGGGFDDGVVDTDLIDNVTMWDKFFRRMLEPDCEARANLEELYSILNLGPPTKSTSCQFEPLVPNHYELQQDNISKLNISQVYYLWRLSIGRNFESEQKQDDCPPIFKIPYLIVSEKLSNSTNEFKPKSHIIIDTKPKLISLDVFKTDVCRLDEKIFHPLILTDEELLLSQDRRDSSFSINCNSINNNKKCNPLQQKQQQQKSFDSFTFADLDNLSVRSSIQMQITESSKIQPIVIKEADFAYQCERIILFKRLLAGYPYLKDQLRRQASIDIPPYYRAQIWAVLLEVCPSKSKQLYENIDKTTPLATDRQISVDIPRCHQYNELMASPQGHQKLARILKTWLNHNLAEYVYWQGLDSLAAPFLLLNFDNEAMAFACFNAFVDKYLRGFFKKDNQLIVQQYLTMFSELLSYHDSSLATHLERLGFLPNLYAIPWFLTMFTHVLPLHKIFHVWDCLLLGDEKFPLCIGLAILNQLREELMGYSFNDCIVAFSDLPEIDIEQCIRDASHFYNSTPDKLINLLDVEEAPQVNQDAQ